MTDHLDPNGVTDIRELADKTKECWMPSAAGTDSVRDDLDIENEETLRDLANIANAMHRGEMSIPAPPTYMAEEERFPEELAYWFEQIGDNHDVCIIGADYFTAYVEEMINDVGYLQNLSAEINSGEWPYRHITLDYEAAAEELKDDYSTFDYEGHTYYLHN